MKSLQTFKTSVILILIAFTLTLGSCLKDNDNASTPNTSALTVIHLAPNTGNLDFFLDNQRADTPLVYTSFFRYFEIFSGNRVVELSRSGTNSFVAQNVAPLQPGKYYSLFIGEKSDSVKFNLFEDNLTAPATGKAKIRIGHFSPGAPNVDVALNNTVVFTNQAYAKVSDFSQVDASDSYRLQIRPTGTTTAVIDTTIKIEANKIYSILARGIVTGTGGKKLSAQVYVNK